jgi:hypothetical protein
MDKELITPGKLYAKLSHEFRERQRGLCEGCRMPMVFQREEVRAGEANWDIESPIAVCETCSALIEQVVHEHADRYDMWDPTAVYARRPAAAFTASLVHRTQ